MRHISASSWMSDFFLGVSENALLADRARFLDISGTTIAIRHDDGMTTWPAGTFDSPTVASLRECVEAAHPARRATSVPLTVVDGVVSGSGGGGTVRLPEAGDARFLI